VDRLGEPFDHDCRRRAIKDFNEFKPRKNGRFATNGMDDEGDASQPR
jgi:hypothetical protein